MNNFVIVVTVYNSEKLIGRCLKSIQEQIYQGKFKAIVIDDCSTDKTWEEIQKFPFITIRNKQHTGSAIQNRIRAIKKASKSSEDIIISVDGDDYLAWEYTFAYLNQIYQDDIWLTYGQYRSLSETQEYYCQPLDHVHTVTEAGCRTIISLTPQTYRRRGIFCTSHLKTFRHWLFDKINNEDLRYKDKYFKTCCDVCMMFPMIEMAGKHIKYIDKVLYIYDDISNDYGKNAEENMREFEYLRSKPIYDEL